MATMSMSTLHRAIFAMALGVATASCAAWAAGDAALGQQLYASRCVACHSVDGNRVGPAHAGVFGRKAGSVADYDYSAAVKKSRVVWGEKTLDAWLANPEKLIPGQKMGYSVSDAQDRAHLVAYLRSLPPASKK